MGATNKPWDLDDAIISRFQKKVYVPLPDLVARKIILQIHLEGADTSQIDFSQLAKKTEGFSGRDISNLCQEAIIKMVRETNPNLEKLTVRELESYSLGHRPLSEEDFEEAFSKIKPSAQQESLEKYEEWKKNFGG
jgi:SpoVK/Ycf46/Vps4 family AAA+-type ATPase